MKFMYSVTYSLTLYVYFKVKEYKENRIALDKNSQTRPFKWTLDITIKYIIWA